MKESSFSTRQIQSGLMVCVKMGSPCMLGKWSGALSQGAPLKDYHSNIYQADVRNSALPHGRDVPNVPGQAPRMTSSRLLKGSTKHTGTPAARLSACQQRILAELHRSASSSCVPEGPQRRTCGPLAEHWTGNGVFASNRTRVEESRNPDVGDMSQATDGDDKTCRHHQHGWCIRR